MPGAPDAGVGQPPSNKLLSKVAAAGPDSVAEAGPEPEPHQHAILHCTRLLRVPAAALGHF